MLKATDWNKMRILAIGDKVTTWLNGVEMVQINDEKIGKSYEDVRGWDPATSRVSLRTNRPPTLRDHVALVSFLASDRSAFMSGHCIPSCDGGVMGRMG